MCSAHATVRGFLGELTSRSDTDRDIVVDMEAGLEHLSRGTGKHITQCLAVIEPYFRSMETARRIVGLATELGVGDVRVVANKVRNAADRSAIGEFCRAHGLNVVAEIPYDAALADAERIGRPPIDHDPAAPAVRAITDLAATLERDGAT